MRILAGLIALLVACSAGPGHLTTVESISRTASGKQLVVARSAAFATDSREVPADVVIQAMRASSMFFDEDIRALAPDITTALPKLDKDERLVVDTSDTEIHLYVASNELQIVSFRDGQEISRHASAIPAPAVETHLTNPNIEHVDVPPPPPTTTTAAPPPPPEVVTPPPPQPTPPPAPPPTPPVTTAHKPKHHPAPPADDTKQTGRLTEAQIRDKLAELDRLKAKGLITDAEYQQKKKALLDQL